MLIATESKLSRPVIYDGYSFNEQLEQAMDRFYNSFLRKEVKPTYNDRPIFFDMSRKLPGILLPYSKSFLHIVSLDDADKYNVYPCNNDISMENCTLNSCGDANLYYFQVLGRWECQYRLSRIHWIPEIFKLANNHDPCIYEWEEIEVGKSYGKYIKRLIRYHCGIDDYIIVLQEREQDYYFITAYPVSSISKKKHFDRQYQCYQKK